MNNCENCDWQKYGICTNKDVANCIVEGILEGNFPLWKERKDTALIENGD